MALTVISMTLTGVSAAAWSVYAVQMWQLSRSSARRQAAARRARAATRAAARAREAARRSRPNLVGM